MFALQTVPKFYRESSTMNWNGTTLAGAEAIGVFLAKMPLSKHDIQSYDCHAIPGGSHFFRLLRRSSPI